MSKGFHSTQYLNKPVYNQGSVQIRLQAIERPNVTLIKRQDASFILSILQTFPPIEDTMGCENSHLANDRPLIKMNVVDFTFMKPQYEKLRKELEDDNFDFDYFISLSCFFDEFPKRYCDRVVSNLQNYQELTKGLAEAGYSPAIFLITHGQSPPQNITQNTLVFKDYEELLRHFRNQDVLNSKESNNIEIAIRRKKLGVKFLGKPGATTSDEAILEAALDKSGISHEIYKNVASFEQSFLQTTCQFVVVDYVFHREVIHFVRDQKIKVICYCSFELHEVYSPYVYYLSNNYLEIVSDLKTQLKTIRNKIPCTKVYVFQQGLANHSQIAKIIDKFNIEARLFSNIEKMIKETTYYFCITVLSAEAEASSLARSLENSDYLERVKIIKIPAETEASIKGLAKIIRNIKRGYKVSKGVASSVDIIDKHHNSTKFEDIRKELHKNSIRSLGYSSLGEYMKTKKYISPFIICNFEEKALLVRYMKQLQCKSKVVVFCSKNRIDQQLRENRNYDFVSSHFGRIIKYIRQTPVLNPHLDVEDDLLFREKVDKAKNKNKRISALKWAGLDEAQQSLSAQTFEYLNVAKETSMATIKQLEAAIASIWKCDCPLYKFSTFKQALAESLVLLRKAQTINLTEEELNILIAKIKSAPMEELLEKIKTFFEADNELGLQINKSLIKTQNLKKQEVAHMKELLSLILLGFLSCYEIPKVGKTKLVQWISNPLIEKCAVGSTLLSKSFAIFYQQNQVSNTPLSKYKVSLELEHDLLVEQNSLVNTFMHYKDKVIFAPSSKFTVDGIVDRGLFKQIRLTHLKNPSFLHAMYEENLLRPKQTIAQLIEEALELRVPLIDSSNEGAFRENMNRLRAIELYKQGEVQQAIEIHQSILKKIEETDNLNSVLENQINYELACFLLRAGNNRQAGHVIKQLMEVSPNPLISERCAKMVSQTVSQDEGGKRDKRISEEAMKTFVEIKLNALSNTEAHACSSDEEGEGIEEEQEEDMQFAGEMSCLEVDELGEMEENLVDLGKQNVQS